MLVREYQGERHTVTVVPDGFLWRDTTYSSLSTIARAITGTAWSGPRFFGVRPQPCETTPGMSQRNWRGRSPGDAGSATLARPRRCNDDHRTQGVALRDLHAQIHRA